MECTEKTGVRDFEFCAQGESPILRDRKRFSEEECGSLDQRMTVWLMLDEIWKSKMGNPAGSGEWSPAGKSRFFASVPWFGSRAMGYRILTRNRGIRSCGSGLIAQPDLLGHRWLRFIIAAVICFAVLLTLQFYSSAHQAELTGFPDEAGHYVTGMMLREYLLGGWKSAAPLPFAERYYVHYPKVAFGHWPPVYYIAQFLWSLPFSGSISSFLLLQTVFLTLTAVALFAVLHNRFGLMAAGAGAGVFLLLPITQELNTQVMAEPLLAFLSFWATWFLARYFIRSETRYLLAFGVLAELAALTKGSGIALFGLPTGLALCMRKWSFFRKPAFWFLHIGLFGVLLPWQYYTWDMVRNGMEGPFTTALFLRQLIQYLGILPLTMGWPLVAGVAAGSILSLWRPHETDPLPLACAVMAVGTLLFHCISPSGPELRRLFMALPAMLFLASAGIAQAGRFLRPPLLASTLPVLVGVLSLLPIFQRVQKLPVGYRPVASLLLGETAGREQAILIASQTDGEGMLIAEIAQAAPAPRVLLVRASKFLAQSDWNGSQYELLTSNSEQVHAALNSIPTRFIVIDEFQGGKGPPHWDLVRQTVEANPREWMLRYQLRASSPRLRAPGEIRVYEHLGLEDANGAALRIDLRRMIGRYVEK